MSLKTYGADRPATVRGLARGLSVLELFSNARPRWRVSEISRALGVPLASTYRMVSTLSAKGYLERTEPRGPLRLGLRFLHFGALVRTGLDLTTVAHPLIRSLAATYGETALLVVPSEHGVVCIEHIEGTTPIRLRLTLGETMPYSAGGAFATTVLAFLPAQRRLRALQDLERQDGTQAVPQTRTQDFATRIGQVQRAGYAVVDGDIAEGIAAVSAPIFDVQGALVGAVGVIGIGERLRRAGLDDLIKAVVGTAKDISAGLGSSGDLRSTG